MGFNNHGYGNIHECSIEGGYVCDHALHGDRIYRYPTRLPFDIPLQRNLFSSPTVAFLLYHEDKMYIGRFDGIISIYRTSDKLLVGLNNWDAPDRPYVRSIGFFDTPLGVKPLELDLRDYQTIYCKFNRAEGFLNQSFVNDDYTLGVNVVADNWKAVQLITERGDAYGIDFWHIQDSGGRRDYPIFV